MFYRPKYAAIGAVCLGVGILLATFFPPVVIAVFIALLIICLGIYFLRC